MKWKDKMIIRYGNGFVPCEVSERWIQFPSKVEDERWIPINIMTKSNDKDVKLCELIISKKDLLRAISSFKIICN